MPRKSIDASLGNILRVKYAKNQKLMNDLMIYMRKILRLAKRIQSNSVLESGDVSFEQEMAQIREGIAKIEAEID